MYSPQLGRWNHIDPLVNKYPSFSPYNYVLNNPIIIKDINGADGVIVIRGAPSTKASQQDAISTTRGDYYMYQMDIYNDMTLLDYEIKSEGGNLYLKPDASMYVARDAWGNEKIHGKHSDQRFGTNNEAPPGIRYLEYDENGVGKSKKHFLRITDKKGEDYVLGPDGKRYALHMHEWSPHDAIGCITFGTNGKNQTPGLDELLGSMNELMNPNETVFLYIEPRENVIWRNGRFEQVSEEEYESHQQMIKSLVESIKKEKQLKE